MNENYCGTCALYTNEAVDGDGWCEFHQEPRESDSECDAWLPRCCGNCENYKRVDHVSGECKSHGITKDKGGLCDEYKL